MARKIRIAGTSICIAIFVAMLIAVGVVSSNSVSMVKNVAISDVADNSVKIKWDAVEDVDGYIAYKKADTEKDFSQASVIKKSTSSSVVVKNLNAYTNYDFYVVAYRQKGDKQIVAKKHKNVACKTLPQSPKITVDSTNKGELSISWSEVENCAGYEVYYKGDHDEKTESIDAKNGTNLMLNDKVAGTEYSAKVRSFVYNKDEKIYSLWSENAVVTISNRHIQSSNIDPNKPMIALSFDDGPDYKGASKRILDVLEKYNAKATFFMLGKNAKGNADNVKRKVALGMEIGNHTYNHDHYGKNVTANDILKASQSIENACGVYPTAFRSPGGMTTPAILAECKSEGMPLYYWSLDTQDWKSRDADKVYNKVMKNVKDGDIILMHEIYSSTAEAVERLVPDLIAKDYQLVTCADLIKYKTGEPAKAGTQYVDYKTIKNITK